MKTYQIVLLTIVFATLSCGTKKESLPNSLAPYLPLDNPDRANWMIETFDQLEAFKPSKDTKVTERQDVLAEDKKYVGSEYLIENNSMIRFGKDQWLYFVYHSMHWSRDMINGKIKRPTSGVIIPNDTIDDITLAIDNNGNIYKNDGHVCGILYVFCKNKIETIDDFLKTKTRGYQNGNTIEMKWEKLK